MHVYVVTLYKNDMLVQLSFNNLKLVFAVCSGNICVIQIYHTARSIIHIFIHIYHTHLPYTSIIHIYQTHLSYISIKHIYHTHLSYISIIHIYHTHLSYTSIIHIYHSHLSCIKGALYDLKGTPNLCTYF